MEYQSVPIDSYLEHHGVKGMKWGVRKYKQIQKESSNKMKKAQKEAHTSYLKSMKAERTTNKDKRQKYQKEADSSRKNYERLMSQVQKNVTRASKLPVTINRKPKAFFAKHIAAAMNIPFMEDSIRKDVFSQAVDYAQKNSKKK